MAKVEAYKITSKQAVTNYKKAINKHSSLLNT